MSFRDPPDQAAWEHREARSGFEVAFFRSTGDGWNVEGDTVAVEDGQAWTVHYDIALSGDWVTRSACVWCHSAVGHRELELVVDTAGRWHVDGEAAPDLDGCRDLDLESSALTNAFPVRRLRLDVGQAAEAPATYVRALDLSVERLEQRYERLADAGSGQSYRYTAPRFDFECRLLYDESGLAVEYPGIAVRA